MSNLETILENSNDIGKKWTNYLAFPYSRAYARALKNYGETKDQQNKLDSQKIEFGVLALSICSGGVLTHVFAQTAWKAVAANKVLNVICEKNWNKAFTAAHFVSENKVANFVVGALWDMGPKIMDDKIKPLFEQNPNNFPSTQKWQTETDALTSLMGFVDECYLKYRQTARNIFDNKGLNDAERTEAIINLTSSSFANPPSKSSIDEARVAMEIELLFYLKMILDLDYTQNFWWEDSGGRSMRKRTGSRIGIEVMPGASNYPHPTGNPGFDGTQIGYNDLGMAYYDRTNSLYKSLYNRKLLTSEGSLDIWNAAMNKQSFMAAFRAIDTLEQSGMQRFHASISIS